MSGLFGADLRDSGGKGAVVKGIKQVAVSAVDVKQ